LTLGTSTSVFSACQAITGLPPASTTVSATTPAGVTELPVVSNAAFSPGQFVQINPGAPDTEVVQVDRVGSLVFLAPLRFGHAAGEPVVSVDPPGGVVSGPGISISSLADGAQVTLGSSNTADYACGDDGMGVASCLGTAAAGSALDTATLGPRTFTVTGIDGEGNETSETVTYVVVASPPAGGGEIDPPGPAVPPSQLVTSPATAGATVTRLAGADRVGTAIAISQATFPAAGSAGAVILARDDDFPDALAGAPLAAKLHAPYSSPGPAGSIRPWRRSWHGSFPPGAPSTSWAERPPSVPPSPRRSTGSASERCATPVWTGTPPPWPSPPPSATRRSSCWPTGRRSPTP